MFHNLTSLLPGLKGFDVSLIASLCCLFNYKLFCGDNANDDLMNVYFGICIASLCSVLFCTASNCC